MTQPAPTLDLDVNGIRRSLGPGPDRPLLFALREELGLTGAKPGCGEGACGACTVLLDGAPVRSCQVRLSDAAGRSVRTVEGLAPEGSLHPVQRAFLETAAFQCGYCTTGMIMSTVALLEEDADPDEAAIRAALADNVCRCGTYPRILRAVERAAELARGAMRGGEGEGAVGSSPASAGRAAAAPEATASAATPAPDATLDPRATDTWRPRRPWDMTPSGERDWFDVLPEGLVVAHEPGPSDEGWTTTMGAWLHVGADGTVTAFTGKVDVGQDNRTSLSAAVADAIGVPSSAVRLVMGDTDLCPHDMGTFGSRSTPDAAPLLRVAGAAARDRLVRLAAERTGVDAADLVAEDGAVRRASAGEAIPYGDLVAGRHLVEQVHERTAPPDATAGEEASPRARVVGAATVTGRRRYPSDLSMPGTLYGRVLHPPVPGATLRSVDTVGAEALPGATVVHEGDFVGVVGPSPFAAGRALAAVAADWDRPTAPDAAGLDRWLREHPVSNEEGDGWGDSFHRESGDVDAALARSPVRLEATYSTAYIAHVPLETHAALARWDDGRVTVWTGTQVPFGVRRQLAEALGLPEDRVRVIVPDTGGGFGGKHGGDIAVEAARLARAAGRPVKVRWSRPEEFTEGYLRPASVIDIRSGSGGETISAW